MEHVLDLLEGEATGEVQARNEDAMITYGVVLADPQLRQGAIGEWQLLSHILSARICRMLQFLLHIFLISASAPMDMEEVHENMQYAMQDGGVRLDTGRADSTSSSRSNRMIVSTIVSVFTHICPLWPLIRVLLGVCIQQTCSSLP